MFLLAFLFPAISFPFVFWLYPFFQLIFFGFIHFFLILMASDGSETGGKICWVAKVLDHLLLGSSVRLILRPLLYRAPRFSDSPLVLSTQKVLRTSLETSRAWTIRSPMSLSLTCKGFELNTLFLLPFAWRFLVGMTRLLGLQMDVLLSMRSLSNLSSSFSFTPSSTTS